MEEIVQGKFRNLMSSLLNNWNYQKRQIVARDCFKWSLADQDESRLMNDIWFETQCSSQLLFEANFTTLLEIFCINQNWLVEASLLKAYREQVALHVKKHRPFQPIVESLKKEDDIQLVLTCPLHFSQLDVYTV